MVTASKPQVYIDYRTTWSLWACRLIAYPLEGPGTYAGYTVALKGSVCGYFAGYGYDVLVLRPSGF